MSFRNPVRLLLALLHLAIRRVKIDRRQRSQAHVMPSSARWQAPFYGFACRAITNRVKVGDVGFTGPVASPSARRAGDLRKVWA